MLITNIGMIFQNCQLKKLSNVNI